MIEFSLFCTVGYYTSISIPSTLNICKMTPSPESKKVPCSVKTV